MTSPETIRDTLNRLVDARKRIATAARARRERLIIEGEESSLEGEDRAIISEGESESGMLLEGTGATSTPTGI